MIKLWPSLAWRLGICHEVISVQLWSWSGREKSFCPYIRIKKENDFITFTFLDQFHNNHNLLYVIVSWLWILQLGNLVVSYRKEWNRRCLFILNKHLFTGNAKCRAMDMKITFYSHANRTRFQRKRFAPRLVLTGRVFGTQKWPINR